MNMIPLCVDLDGTLITNDTAFASVLALLAKNPINIFRVVWWLAQGRAYMKQQLAAHVDLDVSQLSYNLPFLKFLQDEKEKGRKLYLVTASDQKIAKQIADHVGIFDEVMASNGEINLKSNAKREALDQRFGIRGYDYAGNDTPDLKVWKHARTAIVINPSLRLRFRNFFK